MNHELPDRNYRQEAITWIDDMEKLGFYCEAMREHIDSLDGEDFIDPNFKPELIAEVPEMVVFEN